MDIPQGKDFSKPDLCAPGWNPAWARAKIGKMGISFYAKVKFSFLINIVGLKRTKSMRWNGD